MATTTFSAYAVEYVQAHKCLINRQWVFLRDRKNISIDYFYVTVRKFL